MATTPHPSKQPHLPATLFASAKAHADQPAIGAKVGDQWQTRTYREMAAQVRQAARSLLTLGVQAGDRVGVFAPNQPEWSLMDYAILSVGAISVPIYATNTAEQAAYAVAETEMALLFVGNETHLDKVQSVRDILPSLTDVVVFDAPSTLPESVRRFDEFMALGADLGRDSDVDRRMAAISAEDLATIIYTSGTTGEPKGVMLSHANILHQFKAMDGQFELGPSDRSLCFLPLSHVYERSWSYYVYACGAANYYLANPREVIETMADVQPTVMVSVPRLYEKIYAAAIHGLDQGSGLKRKLFHWSVAVGKHYQYQLKDHGSAGLGLRLKHAVADKLVLSKVRAVVGGRKNFFSAGGAPLAKEIEEFFFGAGLLVCEGYGLTETSPMVTFNTPKAFRFGTVGKPIPDCEVKIGELGEILVKSPSVTQGYYKKPEASAEALRDGWFHTGDVGEFDEDGFLRITDRIKDLIITSGGKNVAPQKIQTVYAQDHFIEQFLAIGDRRKYISALIVPNFEALDVYASEQGIPAANRNELVAHHQVHAFYQQRIDALASHLANYERIKQFTLLPAPFSQENDELTPSQKIKRKVVVQRYAPQIEAMYAQD